ncbi:MAG: regulatory protein RecX [Paludibacteraceae bacterium]|nr:regulatory protein RecX [Paludibacteraceae bacterium]
MDKHITYEQGLHRTAALCTASEKCTADIRQKLQDWGADEADTARIIAYLIKEKFLDDTRFCRAFVKDKLRFNKWGKIKIAFALKQKNIDAAIVSDAFDGIDEDDYLDVLKELLTAKQRGLKYKDDYDRKGKLYRFALGRGFEMDAVNKVWKMLV